MNLGLSINLRLRIWELTESCVTLKQCLEQTIVCHFRRAACPRVTYSSFSDARETRLLNGQNHSRLEQSTVSQSPRGLLYYVSCQHPRCLYFPLWRSTRKSQHLWASCWQKCSRICLAMCFKNSLGSLVLQNFLE